MRKIAGTALVTLMLAGQVHAEQRHSKLWRFSAALLASATIADVQSSMGRREANPLLSSSDGRFSARGVSLKALIVGGALGTQWVLLRKNPGASKYAAGANIAAASLTGYVVARNHMLK